MTNQQLLKTAHIWSVGFILAFTVFALLAVVARESNSAGTQNSNANSNSSARNQNSNSSQTQNQNSSKNNAKGERAAMGGGKSPDANFMMDAAMDGLMEVELGKMATTQGWSDAVKQFGQRMVDDHSRANTELMELASSKGVTLPTALDEKHQHDLAKFSKLTGAGFDKAYAKLMVSDHNKAVSLFEKQSTKSTDPDVRTFASKTLPTLQEHLTMAKGLTGAAGGTSSPKNSNSNRP